MPSRSARTRTIRWNDSPGSIPLHTPTRALHTRPAQEQGDKELSCRLTSFRVRVRLARSRLARTGSRPRATAIAPPQPLDRSTRSRNLRIVFRFVSTLTGGGYLVNVIKVTTQRSGITNRKSTARELWVPPVRRTVHLSFAIPPAHAFIGTAHYEPLLIPDP